MFLCLCTYSRVNRYFQCIFILYSYWREIQFRAHHLNVLCQSQRCRPKLETSVKLLFLIMIMSVPHDSRTRTNLHVLCQFISRCPSEIVQCYYSQENGQQSGQFLVYVILHSHFKVFSLIVHNYNVRTLSTLSLESFDGFRPLIDTPSWEWEASLNPALDANSIRSSNHS